MTCPDCDGVARRTFLKTAALGTASLAAAHAATQFAGPSETVVTSLYNSLTPEQKAKVVFSFDDPLRSKVDANWRITPMKIAESSRRISRP
jgi:hypothetical protein